MGFRKEIQIRFLIFVFLAVLSQSIFSSITTLTAEDFIMQSDICADESAPFGEWILERVENNPMMQVLGNNSCYHNLCMDKLLDYLMFDGRLSAFLWEKRDVGKQFSQHLEGGQEELIFGWKHSVTLGRIFTSLNAVILFLIILHKSTLEVIEQKCKDGRCKKNTRKNDFLSGMNALLNTSISLLCPPISSTKKGFSDINDNDMSNDKNKRLWMYDPLQSLGSSIEYLVLSVFERVASFRPLNSIPPNISSVLQLAEAGFIYRRTESVLECQGCRRQVDIQNIDSPATDVKYHAEGCRYIRMSSDVAFFDTEDLDTDSPSENEIGRGIFTQHNRNNGNCFTHSVDNRTSSACVYNPNHFDSTAHQRSQTQQRENALQQMEIHAALPVQQLATDVVAQVQQQISQAAESVQQQLKQAAAPVQQQQLQQAAAPVQQQQQQQAAAPVQQQQLNQAAAPVQQQQNQAAAPVQQKQLNQAAAPVQQQQLNQAAPPVQQQQPNQAAAPVQQQELNQAAAPVHQQELNQAAAPVQQKQLNQAAAPVQQQQPNQAADEANHSAGHPDQMNACASPVTPVSSVGSGKSSDVDEFENECCVVENDFNYSAPCPKNPGHYAYFPLKHLKLNDIPSNARHADTLRFLEVLGKLVVRLKIKETSKARQNYEELHHQPKHRTGTGLAYFNTEREDEVASSEHPRRWNSIRKFIPQLKNKGFIYIVTSRHLVYDDIEAQSTVVQFFYDTQNRKGIVTAKGVSVTHDVSVSNCKSYLKCVVSDSSIVEFVKNTSNELQNLANKLPQKIKEGLQKRVYVISHPHGGDKMMSYGDYVMVKYAPKLGQKDGKSTREMVKINNHTEISQNSKDVRKVLFYTADTCKGSSGGVVISFKTIKQNNKEEIVLDLWMHNGVSKKHGLNASVMEELTPEDIANHGKPNTNRPSVQEEQEIEANRAASQVVRCPVFTVIGSPSHPAYVAYRKRLDSYPNPFDHVHTAVELADAGFFYAGYADCVRCFHCGLGLRSWKPGDSIYEEHHKNRPNCQFLQMKLKATGISPDNQQSRSQNSVQPQVATSNAGVNQQPKLTMVVQNPSSSAMQGFQKAEVFAKLPEKSLNVVRSEEITVGIVQAKANLNEGRKSTAVSILEREQKYLKQLLTCKVCGEKPIKDLFLPCGELVACLDCSKLLTQCPCCNKKILATVTTYFS